MGVEYAGVLDVVLTNKLVFVTDKLINAQFSFVHVFLLNKLRKTQF